MREQIEIDPPLDKVVHSIEYVIRHHGAHHLRPSSCKLSMLQRESMDVTFVLMLLIMIFLYLIVRLSSAVKSRIFIPKTDITKMKNQ